MYKIEASIYIIHIKFTAIELVSPEKRVLGNTIMAVAFAIGEALLGFAAWCTPSWRIMLRLLYTPGFLFISYIWLMQESVRWLISKGKYNKVKRILFKVGRHNGKQVTDNILQSLDIIQEDVDRTQTESIRDVLKCAPLFLRLINCSFSWISCTFVYYGLTMHSVSISGDPYINYIAVAFIEIPAFFVTYFILDRIGRKVTLSSSLLVSGIACVCFIFLDEGNIDFTSFYFYYVQFILKSKLLQILFRYLRRSFDFILIGKIRHYHFLHGFIYVHNGNVSYIVKTFFACHMLNVWAIRINGGATSSATGKSI